MLDRLIKWSLENQLLVTVALVARPPRQRGQPRRCCQRGRVQRRGGFKHGRPAGRRPLLCRLREPHGEKRRLLQVQQLRRHHGLQLVRGSAKGLA